MTDDAQIKTSDLGNLGAVVHGIEPDNLKAARHAFEKDHIRKVLTKCGGDKIRATEALGIDLSSLYRKLSE